MSINEIIDHFITMKKQSEDVLNKNQKEEIGEWIRGLYCGEIRAYKHCIDYLNVWKL